MALKSQKNGGGRLIHYEDHELKAYFLPLTTRNTRTKRSSENFQCGQRVPWLKKSFFSAPLRLSGSIVFR